MTNLMPGQHKQTVSVAAISPNILFSRGHCVPTILHQQNYEHSDCAAIYAVTLGWPALYSLHYTLHTLYC